MEKFIIRADFNSVCGTIVTGYLHCNYAVERETNGVAASSPEWLTSILIPYYARSKNSSYHDSTPFT